MEGFMFYRVLGGSPHRGQGEEIILKENEALPCHLEETLQIHFTSIPLL
jgi:hypothetical protein